MAKNQFIQGEENAFWNFAVQNRWLTHVLFWLFVWLIAPITSADSIKDIKEAFLFRGVAMPMKIIPTYFLVYYLNPYFLHRKKYLQYAIYFLLSSWIFAIIYRFNNVHIAETLAGLPHPKESLWQMIQEAHFTIPSYLPRVYLFTILFLFLKNYKSNELKKYQIITLEREKAKAELNFLKAQIHPHFLFNTLNNLYALTLDKSDDAPEVVAKLADILDYMLYQCAEPQVRIHKEIELINNYIDLEKLRYGPRLQLEFTHSLDQSKAQIAPLILISIVENAFKHGASTAMQNVVIQISLEVAEDQLHFRVFNTKSDTSPDRAGYKKGIGVKNIQRQLELVYPDRYQWEVTEEPNSYEVNFRLNL
ncbi:MAG TPA: histidine kinase [Microscillaceae bacterium]|nr:histidine kinase [Microscillaceae bacterium]